MISVKNLCVQFTKEYFALCDVSIEIKKGESVALLGEEHSGKTTLLRTLTKLETPFSGEIYIKDIPLKKVDFSCDINVGYLPLTTVFKNNKTVYQNMRYLLKSKKYRKSEIEGIINKTLIDFNIEILRNSKIMDITNFEKYVVSFARMCMREIDIALIDNIFDDLSEEEINKLLELIKREFTSKKVTTVIATTKNEIAQKVAKRVIKFNNGSIVD